MARWLFLWAFVLALVSLQAADVPYHGRIEWARLKTPSPSWDRHARGDPHFLQFLRDQTRLDIDTDWHAADVESLRQMTAYPFLFSEGLQCVTDQKGRDNIREYLQRNGFIFIDACINTHVNPDPDVFFKMQIDTLRDLLPDIRVERLAADAPLFNTCFDMRNHLPHSYMDDIYDPAWSKHGLYGVYSNHRLVSLISLSGLQCGWDNMNRHDPNHRTNCMKMMVDIYVYVTAQ